MITTYRGFRIALEADRILVRFPYTHSALGWRWTAVREEPWQRLDGYRIGTDMLGSWLALRRAKAAIRKALKEEAFLGQNQKERT